MADDVSVELARLARVLEAEGKATTEALGHVARELSTLSTTTEKQGRRIESLETRVGGVQDHLVELARTDTETTSQVGDVRVELARMMARAGADADRSEQAARSAQDSAAKAGRGKALRATLQAAGVVVGVALATAAQQCSTAHGAQPDGSGGYVGAGP